MIRTKLAAPVLALTLAFAPMQKAHADPITVGVIVGTAIFLGGFGAAAKATNDANSPFRYDGGLAGTRFSFYCTDKDEKTAILVFRSTTRPDVAVRYVLSSAGIRGPVPLSVSPSYAVDDRATYATESGVTLKMDGSFASADGKKSMHMNCNASKPTSAQLDKWTDAASLAARAEELAKSSAQKTKEVASPAASEAETGSQKAVVANTQ